MIMEGKIIKAREKNEGEYFCDIKVGKTLHRKHPMCNP